MKKRIQKTIKKRAAVTQAKKKSLLQVLFLKRFSVISTLGVLLLMVVVINNNRGVISQSVAGASVFRPLYAQATVSWTPVIGAVAYNIYYAQQESKTFDNAIRNIPATITTYTISYLKKNVQYTYRVSAINATGSEFWWSPIQSITNVSAL